MQKNLSFLIQTVLAIAIAILYYLHFSGTSDTTEAQPIKSDTLVAPIKNIKQSAVVYINSDTLWDKYEYVIKIRKELERERNTAEANFTNQYKALELEYNELRERAANLSQDEGMAKQQELMAKEQQLSDYRDKLTESLSKKEMENNEMLQKNIIEYLDRNYNNTNYTYILGYSRGGGILYAKDSLDITSEVVDGLNAEFKLKKK